MLLCISQIFHGGGRVVVYVTYRCKMNRFACKEKIRFKHYLKLVFYCTDVKRLLLWMPFLNLIEIRSVNFRDQPYGMHTLCIASPCFKLTRQWRLSN
jgi:hypothetical protein